MVNWSPQQQDVFSWFSDESRPSLVVQARAGTGKTTTIIEATNRLNGDISGLLCAFNKNIAVELEGRIANKGFQAQTLHSIGFRAVRMFWENIRLESSRGERAEDLARRASGLEQTPDEIIRLIAKLHTLSRQIVPRAEKWFELEDIAADLIVTGKPN